MEKFKEKLNKALIDQNLKQEDLAKRIKLSRQSINTAINKNDLKVSILEKICEVLKTPIGYWFDEEEDGIVKILKDSNNDNRERIKELKESIELYKKRIKDLEQRLEMHEDENKSKIAI